MNPGAQLNNCVGAQNYFYFFMSIITGIILTLLLLGIMVLNIFHVFIMPFHKWQLTQVTRETRLADKPLFNVKNVCLDI